MTSPMSQEQASEASRWKSQRMSRNATTADGDGSFALESQALTAPSESSKGAKSTQSPASSRVTSRTKLAPGQSVAQDLGESTRPRKRRGWNWAKAKLHRGFPVSRHGWANEPNPKRLRLHVEGFRETERLFCAFEDGQNVPFSRLTWADLNAYDWYIPEQLELTK